MGTLTIAIVSTFVLGYLGIAVEHSLRVNKAAFALLMCVGVWVLYMIDPLSYLTTMHADYQGGAAGVGQAVSEILQGHLGSTAETLFFLMGAMTIVEVVDTNGGFNFVRDALETRSKRKLLWKIMFMTFFLSAALDNLTTSIVMIMVLRKLVSDHKDRLIYASLIVIAANSGGAFSPIGDVTTIMLWIKGTITTAGVMKEIFIPSLISAVIPTLILQMSLKGELSKAQAATEGDSLDFPPFMGILLVLSVLWLTTELFYRNKNNISDSMKKRISKLLSRLDMSTILFFLGILMAVACLEEIGVLHNLGSWLDGASGGNHYLVTGIIGVASSIVDNVPLVAGCMGMYPIAPSGDMAVDGVFWQLLAYCAGVGGSMLIIGSAAGVVVMGLENISFGWYMKRISWVALVGYLAGIAYYWVERHYIFP